MRAIRTLIIVYLLGWLLLFTVAGQTTETKTVSIVVSETLTITAPREDAIELLKLYERHQLVHEDDIQLYGALQLALGDISKKDLLYGEGEETWAARKVREWRSRKD